jgi:deazaflavin-dependent oxidoreductase (nitroreductase family)
VTSLFDGLDREESAQAAPSAMPPDAWARGLRRVRRSRVDARRAYDRAARWAGFEEVFERRAVATGLRLLAVQPGERVLEVGCGGGAALVELARAVGPDGRAVGLDLSPAMIRRSAVRLRRAGLRGRTELRVADATSLPFPDASFDALFLSFALELFDTPEIPLVLGECRRLLRPGGRIGVVALSRSAPVRWPTRIYERLHDRFPATLDCRPIHARLALEAAGFEGSRSARVPLWGLRAEAVVAYRPPAPTVEPATAGLSEAARQPAPPGGALRLLLGLPVHLYRARLGFLLGHRFLLLVSTGRKTGLRRETVLEVVHYDPTTRESIVLAGWGRRAGWLHNVEAGLAGEVRTGRDRYVPDHRLVPPDEAAVVLAEYERRNRVIAPIVRAVLGRLLGWGYDGSPDARRRAVEQLPLVGLRPRDAGT